MSYLFLDIESTASRLSSSDLKLKGLEHALSSKPLRPGPNSPFGPGPNSPFGPGPGVAGPRTPSVTQHPGTSWKMSRTRAAFLLITDHSSSYFVNPALRTWKRRHIVRSQSRKICMKNIQSRLEHSHAVPTGEQLSHMAKDWTTA